MIWGLLCSDSLFECPEASNVPSVVILKDLIRLRCGYMADETELSVIQQQKSLVGETVDNCSYKHTNCVFSCTVSYLHWLFHNLN